MENLVPEKAFVVVGKSLEAALDKAAIVLHHPKDRIAYEVLQEPKPSKYGQPNIACKLRVIPIAPSADEMAPHPGLAEEEGILRVDVPLPPEELGGLTCEEFLRLSEAAAQEPVQNATEEVLAKPDPLREVIGNVGLAIGPIDHHGDLHIHGNVQKGMTIHASGAIHIFGDVETAFVDAGEDIIIRGGLLGTARSARGRIECRFAQGANIAAPHGDVWVRESAMHIQIHAGGEAQIGGVLLGGVCYGEKGVQLQTAGSMTGVPTTITAGHNARLHEQLEQIRQRAQRHVERLNDCENLCRDLLPQEEAGIALPGLERTRLWQAQVRRARLSEDLRALIQKKAHLLGMINTEHRSRICVAGSAYPRVKLSIDEAGLELRAVTQFATFSKDYETGELRITPLH